MNKEIIKTAGNEDIQLNFKGYAGNVYDKDSYFAGNPNKGVALANWNHIDEKVAENLSRMGVCLEESRDHEVCCECGKVVRMLRPNSLDHDQSWFKDAAEIASDYDMEKDVFCGNCVRENPQDVVNDVLSDPSRCITVASIDLSKVGFEKVLSGLERGVEEGQDADPSRISDSLKERGVSRFLFVMDAASVKTISFSVYVDNDELHLIDDPDDIAVSGFSMKDFMDDAVEKIRQKVDLQSTDEDCAGFELRSNPEIMAAHASSDYSNVEPIMMTHEEACYITSMPDMGMKYLVEIKRIIEVENDSEEDADEVWNSHEFRKVVFNNVGANREGEINRVREDSKNEFYSDENIKMFYRRILPSLLQ